MPIIKLSRKHQIVLPKEAREAMNVKGGDKLLVVVKNGITVIMPKPSSYHEALSGLGKGLYKDSHQYLEGERASWRRGNS